MAEFLNMLSLIGDSVFTIFTQIFNLYTTQVVLGASLGLWVLYRIMKLFHLI